MQYSILRNRSIFKMRKPKEPSMKILVAYISKTGTTEEIARRIGEILGAKGAEKNIDVEVAPIDGIGSVRGYDRLILGSPVNGMKVLPQFKEFLGAKVAGSNVPADIFIVSYLFERGRKVWKKAIRKDLEKIRTLAGASSAEIFAGRLPGPLPAFARFIFGTPKDLPLDMRDWGKIEAWAEGIAERM
jgi:menaquinone-dependent protoporphyrinogen oxidase